MTKSPHKYHLLLDENVEARKQFTKLNNFHNVRHIITDFHMSGIKDIDVFELGKNRMIYMGK